MVCYITDQVAEELACFCPQLRTQVMHKLHLLANNPAHNSLQVHRIANVNGKWICYVNRCYRIIYERKDGVLHVWRLGNHDIVDRVRYTDFPSRTLFRPMH